MKRALFLDRDGVINVDRGYVSRIEHFKFIDGTIEALQTAQGKGYLLIVVTNQSGIGRGYYTLDDFQMLTAFMLAELYKNGIDLKPEQIFYCPHAPEEACACRKPEPGMFLKAQKRFDIDLKNSWMVGDKISDLVAAQKAGVGHLVKIGEGSELADHVVNSLAEVRL